MLFVYGTLQDGDLLAAVLGRPIDTAALRPAVAPGHRAIAYPGRVYPALVPAGGEAAPGHILTGLTPLDLAVLDAFEGDEYRRGTITIIADGAAIPAAAYLPARVIAAEGPDWSLAQWTALHKPAVIGSETGSALALRQRLAARRPT